MDIEQWWARLSTQTQQWLTANNGDAVPPAIVAEVAAVGGPAADGGWWDDVDGSRDRGLPDDAVDWIEAAANGEVAGA